MNKRMVLTQLVVCGMVSASVAAFATAEAPRAAAAKAASAGAPAEVKREEMLIGLKAPLFSQDFAQFPIAKVNDEKISLQDLTDAVSALHTGVAENKKAAKVDYGQILDRLVNSALIVQEAHTMGLDDLPEVKEVIRDYDQKILREKLMSQHVKDLKAEPKDVEKAYQDRISQWKITSLVFKKEEDAKAAEKQLKKGKKFQAVYDQALKSGKADKGKDENYLKMESMPPDVFKTLSKMKIGSYGPVIPLQTGFMVFRLDDMKKVDDAKVKEQVGQEVLTGVRYSSLEKYRDDLVKKHVKVKKDLVAKLDFEAKKPGFEAMLKDKTVIAEIPGEAPVTVSDLAESIKAKFYHGVENATKEKKVNKSKKELLDEILGNRALLKEARVQKLDKDAEYLKKVNDFTKSVLFGVFIQKVVEPDIKLTVDEMKAYYKDHLKEFTYPEMYRVDAIVFASNKDAESAIDKLRKGMDYKWFKENAEGRLPNGTAPKLVFDGSLVMKTQMPEDVQKSLMGAKSGEYRQFVRDDQYYVLNVQEVIPAREQPMSDVEEQIKKAIYIDKLNKSVESWAAKLRAAYTVKIYADFKK